MAYHTLIPAYGRVYTSKAAVIADWKANKDFRHAVTGQYLNRSGAAYYLPGDSIRPQTGKGGDPRLIESHNPIEAQ